jgi:2,3,4,5-tetrahydropyridine-2-carboxylate N-succinyltransferase
MKKNLDLKSTIEKAFNGDIELSKPEVKEAVKIALAGLDTGKFRVCDRDESGKWQTHAWLKQAILLFFKTRENKIIKSGDLQFFDKVPLKKWSGKEGVRIVPQAVVRYGAHVESGAILMPSYVNIGAYVGSGTLVDTWATVGSCAQVGKNVHLSGGVGLGGVLEPVQANPVIIEDEVFVGSRCVIVEGALIEQHAVLGAGCVITASTKIIDVTQKKAQILKGRVPAHSVVIPGTIQKEFAAGSFGVPCALIIGTRSAKTNLKTSLNDALRTIAETEGAKFI